MPALNSNGHRRRQLRARVLAEEDTCYLCGQPVDKTLTTLPGQHGAKCRGDCTGCVPHPRRAEVDEIIPRSRGGSPYDRRNTALSHRECNRLKSDRSAEWAQAKIGQHNNPVTASASITNLLTW